MCWMLHTGKRTIDHRIPSLQPATLPSNQQNQYGRCRLWTISVYPLLKNIIGAIPWSHHQFKGRCAGINKSRVHGVKGDSGILPGLCLSHNSRIWNSIWIDFFFCPSANMEQPRGSDAVSLWYFWLLCAKDFLDRSNETAPLITNRSIPLLTG